MTEAEDNEPGDVITLLGETEHDHLVEFAEYAKQFLDLGDLEVGELRLCGECRYTKITVESQSWCSALRTAIAEFEGRETQVASIEQIDSLLTGEKP